MEFSQIAYMNHHGDLVAVWIVLCYLVQVILILKTENKTYKTILNSNQRNIREWTSKGDWGKLCFMKALQQLSSCYCHPYIWIRGYLMPCGMNLSHNKKNNRFTEYSKGNGNYSCLFQGSVFFSVSSCAGSKSWMKKKERGLRNFHLTKSAK